MSSIALFNRLLEVFEEETYDNIEALSCPSIDALKNQGNQDTLGRGSKEYYSKEIESILNEYSILFNDVNAAAPIPKTMKYFKAYVEACEASVPDTYLVPDIESILQERQNKS